MIINRVEVQNYGPFKKAVLNFSEIPDGIIGITGANGSGKTHLLETLFSIPLKRSLLYYDSPVQNHFTDDGMVSVEYLVHGTKVESIIRGRPGKTPECYLKVDGASIAGPGPREYDKAIKEIFPSLELIVASRCSSQNNPGGFFGLSKTDQHSTFSSLMNTYKLDKLISIGKSDLSKLKTTEVSTQDTLEGLKEKLRIAKEELAELKQSLDQKSLDVLDEMDLSENLAKAKQERNDRSNQQFSYWSKCQTEYNKYEVMLSSYLKQEKQIQAMIAGLEGVDLNLDICKKCTLSTSTRIQLEAFANLKNPAELFSDFCKKVRTFGEIPYFDNTELNARIENLESRVANLTASLAPYTNAIKDKEFLISEYEYNIKAIEAHEKVKSQRQVIDQFIEAVSKTKRQVIESIAPLIIDVTNDLLLNFENGKWQVTIPTEKANKSNSGTKENFNPIMLNTWSGKYQEKVSGGELAIIAECLRNGFFVASSRILNVGGGTLCRDEAIGHISREYLDTYMNILRKSMEMGHYEKMLFVCHQDNIIDSVDYILHIENGVIVEG